MSMRSGQGGEGHGVKYFLISYVDLFGAHAGEAGAGARRSPTCRRPGAGFAGFATWLDMTPADPDLFAVPDPDSLIQLPWKPEVAWVAADRVMDGKPVEQAPRFVLKRLIADAAKDGFEMQPRRRVRILPDPAGRRRHRRRRRHASRSPATTSRP